MKLRWLLISVLLLALSLALSPVQAQEKYPTRAIDIFVPFAAGGSVDLTARIAAAYVNKQWGVPVNVINKPGGNAVIACLEVHRAAPDGYTLLSDSPASTSLMQAAVRNLPFKIMDRTFIGRIVITPMALFVHSSSPLKNMKDLEAEGKVRRSGRTWVKIG